MMNSTMQQVCLVNATVIATELFGTINKNELSITMCHQSHYAPHFEIFTTFTGGINSASCSYTSFLNLLQHHCILIHPSWTTCRGFSKFLYEAVPWAREHSLLSRIQDYLPVHARRSYPDHVWSTTRTDLLSSHSLRYWSFVFWMTQILLITKVYIWQL